MQVRPFQPSVLTQILRQKAKGVPGTVGVYVTDLPTGKTASLNPHAEFYGASTLKVPIAMAVLKRVDEGKLSLDDKIAYREEDFQAGAGSLQATIKPGDRIAVRELLRLMIVISDNIARNMLERHIGSDYVREYMNSLGATPPYDPVSRLVTPYGMNNVLIALDSRRSGLSEESTRLLLDWMKSTTLRRIAADLPEENVWVAHKTGSWPGEFHDFGLVYAPNRSHAISVFVKGAPEQEAEEAIANIAAAVYWYIDSLVQKPA